MRSSSSRTMNSCRNSTNLRGTSKNWMGRRQEDWKDGTREGWKTGRLVREAWKTGKHQRRLNERIGQVTSWEAIKPANISAACR